MLVILRKSIKKSYLEEKKEFSHKNYIFELFKILQYKTEMNLGKVICLSF